MLPLTPGELAGFRDTQTDAMMDECVRWICGDPTDSDDYGGSNPDFTEGDATECGLDMRPGSERHNPGKLNALEYDATLRLPLTFEIESVDQVEITKRYGEALSPTLFFSVSGPVQRGPSGIRVALKRVVPSKETPT